MKKGSINKNKFRWHLSVIVILIFSFISCGKNILDIKSDKSLVIPTTLKDFQALLDANIQNQGDPILGEIGGDNYYLEYSRWQALRTIEQNEYIWADSTDIYGGADVNDWNIPYQRVFYCNVVLEGLKDLAENEDSVMYKSIKGCALYLRAQAFYQLAQIFSGPYDSATAASDLGIPLRLSPDIHEKSMRATLQQTYDQILGDLHRAEDLLPLSSGYVTRPSRVAAWALLSRIYLSMGNFDKSLFYSDLVIAAYPTLIDYNQMNTASSNPFQKYNPETIFYAQCSASLITLPSVCPVDTNLYRTYSGNDLRKDLFFTTQPSGLITFKGGYTGGSLLFAGIANDEIYLNRAESYARLGNVAAAIGDLNTLLAKRFKTGSFVEISTAITRDEAIAEILAERRKELIFRCLRWTDLRRLNKNPGFAVTIKRNLNGQTYTLLPNDPRYVYPIPEYEIRYSGIAQNPR